MHYITVSEKKVHTVYWSNLERKENLKMILLTTRMLKNTQMKNSTNSALIMMRFLHFILGIIIDYTFTTDNSFKNVFLWTTRTNGVLLHLLMELQSCRLKRELPLSCSRCTATHPPSPTGIGYSADSLSSATQTPEAYLEPVYLGMFSDLGEKC